jgi:hypothetical protein
MKTKEEPGKGEVILTLSISKEQAGYAIYRNFKIDPHGTWKFGKSVEGICLYENLIKITDEYKVTQIIIKGLSSQTDDVFSIYRATINLFAHNTKIPILLID